MSDRPSEPTYVPTRVVLEMTDGVGVGAARYPAPAPYPLRDRTIATFAGAVAVRVPITVSKDAVPGPRRLHGAVRFQACTPSRCLFPATRAFEVTLDVAP